MAGEATASSVNDVGMPESTHAIFDRMFALEPSAPLEEEEPSQSTQEGAQGAQEGQETQQATEAQAAVATAAETQPGATHAAPAVEQKPQPTAADVELANLRAAQAELGRRLAEAEARAAQPQPQVQPQVEAKPDLPPNALEDPIGYSQWVQRQFAARDETIKTELARRDEQYRADLQKQALSFDLAMHRRADPATFDAAMAAAQDAMKTDPTLRPRLMAAPSMGEALMNWYQMRELGSDPATIRARIREELAKDPAFVKAVLDANNQSAALAGAQAQNSTTKPTNVVRLPASIAQATSAASDDTGADDLSSDGILDAMMRTPYGGSPLRAG